MPAPKGITQLNTMLEQLWPPPYEVLFSSSPQPRWTHLGFSALPSAARPTVLIPTAPRRVAATALLGYRSPMTRRARVTNRLTSWAGHLGATRLLPGVVQVRGPADAPSILTHFASALQTDVHVGMSFGPPRANRKPVLQLLSPTGTCLGFAKIGVDALTRFRVSEETAALRSLTPLDLGGLIVPKVLELPWWQQTPILLTEPVKTWSAERMNPAVRDRALRGLIEAVGTKTFALADSPWWYELCARLSTMTPSDDVDRLSRCRDALVRRFGHRDLLHGAAHGDWSPWNLNTDNGCTVAWDWERFSSCAPVGLDTLHFAVQEQVRLAGLPPARALDAVSVRAGELVARNGGLSANGLLLMALYLLQLGERFLSDGQQEAGSRRGALGTWLLPTLEKTTASLGGVIP